MCMMWVGVHVYKTHPKTLKLMFDDVMSMYTFKSTCSCPTLLLPAFPPPHPSPPPQPPLIPPSSPHNTPTPTPPQAVKTLIKLTAHNAHPDTRVDLARLTAEHLSVLSAADQYVGIKAMMPVVLGITSEWDRCTCMSNMWTVVADADIRNRVRQIRGVVVVVCEQGMGE